jgi:hypothetical protein
MANKTPGDAGRVNPDPFGYFSCRLNAARFLDIDQLDTNLIVVREKKAYDRSLVLADGTILKQSATNSDGKVAKSDYVLSVASRGSRSVILKTGKKTPNTSGLIYHTLTFRFPSWATIWCIADALGEIIPTTKIKNDATATDVFPYFTVKGGRKYPIMLKSDAEDESGATVAKTKAQAELLLAQSEKKGRAKKGAGGA